MFEPSTREGIVNNTLDHLLSAVVIAGASYGGTLLKLRASEQVTCTLNAFNSFAILGYA